MLLGHRVLIAALLLHRVLLIGWRVLTAALALVDRVRQRARLLSRAPEPRTGSWLVALGGRGEYRVRGRLVAGRAPDCEIQLRDRTVSRHHFELVDGEGGCVVSDLASRNGVFVNEERVHVSVLADNDVIRVGRCAFRFKSVH